jgi:saccharopine dehydrogenase (NADP+, L-glutamate forming)
MMQNILILGAGLVAKPMVQYLLEKKYHVTVASNTPDRASQMIRNHPNGISVYWEATDEAGLAGLISDHDLTVSLLPYVFHLMVARHCIKYCKNMVTTSYVKPEMKALDRQAKAAGIIILNEIGLDPGIDHMSAMRIIDKIHAKEGAVLEFYSICGALPSPEASGNPLRYKFSWSPKGVVMAGNNDALFLQHGQKMRIPTKDLFKNPFKINFPGVGLLDVYPNRDSIAYKDIYGIPEAQTMYRGTFRYQGWCETLDVIKQLNLISCDKYDMTGMTYAEMVFKELTEIQSLSTDTLPRESPGQGRDIQLAVSDFLSIPSDSHALQAMKWLGLFDDTPMNRGIDSTFEVTSDLMISKMTLGSEERDMVALQHTFLAGYSDGHKEVIRSRMLDFGSPSTDTSIARTVALPAAIGVEMILNGKITETGVHIPVIPEIYNPVLDHLETMGIRMVEEYGLQLTENIS